MQSKMINTTLISGWNDVKNSFNADLHNVETYGIHPNYDYNHYLFLKRELGVTADTWTEAKKNGLIRHAKLYRGKFLDYIVQKQFNTIEEWVADVGGKMDDVLYGENRVVQGSNWEWDPINRIQKKIPYKAKYVELNTLLSALGYTPPPVADITTAIMEDHMRKCDKLTDMLAIEMGMRGLSISRVYVLDEANALVPWTSFIAQ
jgi:hypothetical protein